MRKISFRYTANLIAATPTQPQSVAYRPQLPVSITAADGKSVRFLAILDTGADACLFPMSAALLLGLNVLHMPRAYTGGVGSQANLTVYETVTIDLGDGVSFTTRAGFTEGLDAIGVGLLGQIGFFEHFNVEFRHADRVFVIETHDIP